MFSKDSKKVINYHEQEYGIQISELTNTIRFSLKYKGAIEAYVVGDFNNWEKVDNFKLDFGLDTSDMEVKLLKEVRFPHGLKEGLHRYGYIIIDIEGNEITINDWKINLEEFSFEWKNFNEILEIKTSANFISKDYPVQMILVRNSLYGNITIEEAEFYLEEEIEGAFIKEDYLYVSYNTPRDQVLKIACKDKDTEIISRKEIKIAKDKVEGVFLQFIKGDKAYSGDDFSWNIWSFSNESLGEEIKLDINTDLGIGSYLVKDEFILRKKVWGYGWVNEWNEQTITFNLNRDKKVQYLIYETNEIVYSLKDAINSTVPKIETAIMDSNNKIKAYLSHKPLIGIKYAIYVNGIKANNIYSIVKERDREVILTNLPKDIEPSDLLEVRTSSMFKPCRVLMREYLNDFYYGGNDLGVTLKKDTIGFKIWSPTAKKIEVLIFKDNYDEVEDYYKKYECVKNKATGTFSTVVSRTDAEEKYFLYRLYFNMLDNSSKPYTKITYAIDPYIESVGENGVKGAIIDLSKEEAVPEGFNNYKRIKDIKIEEAIIYEMHIRDFTVSETSGIDENIRGKFLGACKEGSKFINEEGIEVSTGIDHLKELGITHVHLLPVFDFDTVDEGIESSDNRNWGYDPKNYNALEGSYSTNPKDPYNRIYEFRKLVQNYHKNGIKVVLDMVYNHMHESSNMDNIVEGYYFRSNHYGRYTNGSGCGNEIATERPMVRKFIIDSILHWVRDYHIDGLRFDLMGLMDVNTMEEIVTRVREIDSEIIIYGEPWKGGESALIKGINKGSQKGKRFSIFNDEFRDALRGDNSPTRGFINGEQHNREVAWKVVEGLRGSINTIAKDPMESINYLDSHDNYTIWDQIVKTDNYTINPEDFKLVTGDDLFDNKYIREDLLGASLVFTAQGIPFFCGGDEILRSKNGDHNSYKSPDFINEFRWDDKIKYNKIFEYYKGLIKIRKKFKLADIKTKEDVKERVDIFFYNNNDTSGAIINRIKGEKELIIIYNASAIDNYDVNESIVFEDDRPYKILTKDFNINEGGFNLVYKGEIPKLKSFETLIISK